MWKESKWNDNDVILASSPSSAHALMHLLKNEKMSKIPNFYWNPLGIDGSKFKLLSKRDARNALGLPNNRYIILSLVRLSPFDKADLSPLLIVMNVLNKKNIKPLLLIAGDDSYGYGTKLYILSQQMKISENIIFIPKVLL